MARRIRRFAFIQYNSRLEYRTESISILLPEKNKNIMFCIKIQRHCRGIYSNCLRAFDSVFSAKGVLNETPKILRAFVRMAIVFRDMT